MAITIGFPTEFPFEELDVTRTDIILGSIVFGFYFGFAIHVGWTAILETRRARRLTGYILMLWLEIAADTGFAIASWGYLYKIFPPGLGLFLSIILMWILQVTCLMLIIVNRLCILYSEPHQRFRLRFTVSVIVGLISVSSACIWIPAQLQISAKFIWLNHWWDKFEKSVYLLLDLALNLLFIRVVKTRLVQHGLKKYDRVMKFNQYIIIVSIAMDVLLISMTALPNGFVYCQIQFHPVVYIVKLNIEMAMSRLLIKVARSTGINVYEEEPARTSSHTTSGNKTNQNMAVHVTTQVYTEHPDEFEMNPRVRKEVTFAGSTKSDPDIKATAI
ncbi:hypothetical protein CPB85DRAFT_1431111 [Mucidula mucida]|nr:hypothetical protein CPB85DRAFT_1431111 [Mucidula mucida]